MGAEKGPKPSWAPQPAPICDPHDISRRICPWARWEHSILSGNSSHVGSSLESCPGMLHSQAQIVHAIYLRHAMSCHETTNWDYTSFTCASDAVTLNAFSTSNRNNWNKAHTKTICSGCSYKCVEILILNISSAEDGTFSIAVFRECHFCWEWWKAVKEIYGNPFSGDVFYANY